MRAQSGFTEAELAAARWNKKHLKDRKDVRKRSSHSDRNSRQKYNRKFSSSSSSNCSDSSRRSHSIPCNPRNPLLAAYERGRLKKITYDDDVSAEPNWTHDAFYERSPSPERERTKGSHWNTRQGAWKSKAGGVYIPPSPVKSDSEDEVRPARYKTRWNVRRYTDRPDRSRSPIRERPSPEYK